MVSPFIPKSILGYGAVQKFQYIVNQKINCMFHDILEKQLMVFLTKQDWKNQKK